MHLQRNCHFCICKVCGALKCPHMPVRYVMHPNSRGTRCLHCQQRDNIHLLDCDWFRPKPIHRYKIIRRTLKRDMLLERLCALEKLLEQLLYNDTR